VGEGSLGTYFVSCALRNALTGPDKSGHQALYCIIVRSALHVRLNLRGTRMASFSEFDDFVDTKIYGGDRIRAGNILEGPCIVEERMTTLVIPPSKKTRLDLFGNYMTMMEG
jgi:hypothetical protein